MKINAIIVEDEQDNIDILNHFINSYCPSVKIIDIAMSVTSAKELISTSDIQLIFLDIMLEDGTGFELLDLIKKKNTQVIFITAFNKFAVKAFKYSAIDYLLKPLQIEELVTAVNKVEKRLTDHSMKDQLDILMNNLIPKKKEDDFIAIPMVSKIEFIKTKNITYIEADGKYSTFKMENNDKIVSSKNIGEYEKTLNDNPHFFRVHNTFVVNLNFVSSIGKVDGLYCIMENGENIPISRRKKEDLFARLSVK